MMLNKVMKIKEFLEKWCMPDTTDESVAWQFKTDLENLEV